MGPFDLAVVGAGIVGLAHALAAARRGLRVVVMERDAIASGASIRNFGFVTIAGQERGDTRNRALRSREVWTEVAQAAGIAIVQRGTLFVAQRPEALAVLAEYAASDMGGDCRLLDAKELRRALPELRSHAGGMATSGELRIEARDAMVRIAAWLQEAHGVEFLWRHPVIAVEGARVRHAHGNLEASAVVLASGTAITEFAPHVAERAGLRQCTLQMMRVANPGIHLPAVVMSDLSLLRYGGLAGLPAAAALRGRLEGELHQELAEGVHLILAQSANGSWVVGDSHRYGPDALPFGSSALDDLILQQVDALFGHRELQVTERWLGHYATAEVKPLISEEIAQRVRVVSVTNGLGMSTAFAIGEETVAALFGAANAPAA